jgi:transposase
VRFQVLSALLGGCRPREIVAVLDVSLATVYRVRRLYLDGGVQALSDGRSTRGRRKVTPAYLICLARETDARPSVEQEGVSNWTLARLARRLGEITGIWIHFTWLWQLLRQIGFGLKRTRPVIRRCNPRRRWQWAALVRILRRIQPGEVLLFVDEADIDFNPKTGFIWCRRGQPAEIETPGRNQKRYLAGALNVDTGHFLHVELDTGLAPK